MGYSWISDGIAAPEHDALRLFSKLLGTAGDANSGSLEILTAYSWISDGITGPERDALDIFSTLLETTGAQNSGVVETLVGYDWVADGITVPEPDTINRLRDLLLAAGDVDSGSVETLARIRLDVGRHHRGRTGCPLLFLAITGDCRGPELRHRRNIGGLRLVLLMESPSRNRTLSTGSATCCWLRRTRIPAAWRHWWAIPGSPTA